MKLLKIGDTVNWRGGWGSEPPEPAKILRMEITQYPREKYGNDATEVSWELVKANRVCFDLDNGHWAYSDQITPYEEESYQ